MAILVAVAVPMWQQRLHDRAQEQDRRLQARSLALAIHPALMEIQTYLEDAPRRITEGINLTEKEHIVAYPPISQFRCHLC